MSAMGSAMEGVRRDLSKRPTLTREREMRGDHAELFGPDRGRQATSLLGAFPWLSTLAVIVNDLLPTEIGLRTES